MSGTVANAHTPDSCHRWAAAQLECGLEHDRADLPAITANQTISGVTVSGLTCDARGHWAQCTVLR